MYILKELIHKKDLFATNKGLFKKGELIILVNSSTTQRVRVVGGAIQDNKRGIILGRRTFGKGLVQQPLVLPDSSELRITTSRYYTPFGKCIQKPYGDSINYENDLLERIENGELTNNVSINDESKFKGGIMPDIYCPLDTADYNEQVNKIIYTKKWRDFCFKYYEKYPTSKFSDVKEFYFNFNLKNNELEKFLNTNFYIRLN